MDAYAVNTTLRLMLSMIFEMTSDTSILQLYTNEHQPPAVFCAGTAPQPKSQKSQALQLAPKNPLTSSTLNTLKTPENQKKKDQKP